MTLEEGISVKLDLAISVLRVTIYFIWKIKSMSVLRSVTIIWRTVWWFFPESYSRENFGQLVGVEVDGDFLWQNISEIVVQNHEIAVLIFKVLCKCSMENQYSVYCTFLDNKSPIVDRFYVKASWWHTWSRWHLKLWHVMRQIPLNKFFRSTWTSSNPSLSVISNVS